MAAKALSQTQWGLISAVYLIPLKGI